MRHFFSDGSKTSSKSQFFNDLRAVQANKNSFLVDLTSREKSFGSTVGALSDLMRAAGLKGVSCRKAARTTTPGKRVRLSMGSVGDTYDNAMCESFFATLECELLAMDDESLFSDFVAQPIGRRELFDKIHQW